MYQILNNLNQMVTRFNAESNIVFLFVFLKSDLKYFNSSALSCNATILLRLFFLNV